VTGEARGAVSRGAPPPPADEPQTRAAGFLGTIPWRSYRVPLAAGAILAVLALLAIAAPLVAPHDPNAQDLLKAYTGPSAGHPLGYDSQGRDVLSRLIYGAQTTFLGALGVVLISEIIGVPLGIIAGYYGGWVDELIMRTWDMVLSFPPLLLAIAIVATFGHSLTVAVVALGIVYTPSISRLVRSVTLVQREQTYVEASHALGYGGARVMFRHILPNVSSPIIVQFTIDLGYAVLDLAALSFLGLGVQPPQADWGSMLSEGREALLLTPIPAVSAGLAIMLVVICFNLFGDGLRSLLDPRLRSV
jgi:peptide/nickel transport system permease protein